MFRSLAVLVGVGLVVFQVACAWPESRNQDEIDREIEQLKRILAEEAAENEKADKRAIAPKSLSIVGKPTSQSSNYQGHYTPDKAADGNFETIINPGNLCTHTNQESHPWWKVDLGGVHCISSVAILNREDCCSERLTNAVVRAGTSPTPTENRACGSPVTAAQAAVPGDTIDFECQRHLRARYISVDIPNTSYLTLCELTVKELPLDRCSAPTELDLVGQPTKQSSTYQGAYPASKAVDGNHETIINPGHLCTHTNEEPNPWWRVDLGGVHCISNVAILNRQDCCNERLEGAVVRAGSSLTSTDNPACGSPVTATQAGEPGDTIEFECHPPLRARYISVDIPGTDYLTLCEVTAWELPLDQCSATTEVDLVGQPTAQSSTYGGAYPASKAVDGNHETIINPGHLCTHTNEEPNPWWRVDLGGEHCISSVAILNREDCCNERLADAVVRAGSSLTPTDNPACGSPVTADQAGVPGATIEFECDYPLSARYISVDIPGNDYLTLCEVTAREIPLGQCPAPTELDIVDHPTVQSSTYQGVYPASRAVDGIHETIINPGHMCSHTNDESNPWWRVDLGGVHCISSVAILNREDCCSERLTKAVVRAGTSTTIADNGACGSPVTAAQAAVPGGTIEFQCSPVLRARYISVNIPGNSYLQLCEVNVEELLPGWC